MNATGGPTPGAPRTGSSGRYAGCEPGTSWMSDANVALTHSRIGRPVRKFCVSGLARADQRVAGFEEHADVGAPESVDRLLRVTHEEQPAGLDGDRPPVLLPSGRIVGRDEHRELDLDRVGVLELVEEQPLVARRERSAHTGTLVGVAQHGAGEHEEVVELELTRAPAGLGAADGEVRQRRREHLQHRLLNVAAQHLAVGLEVGEPSPHDVDADARASCSSSRAADELGGGEQLEPGVVVDGLAQPLRELLNGSVDVGEQLVGRSMCSDPRARPPPRAS